MASKTRNPFEQLAKEALAQPQAEWLPIGEKQRSLSIGIPREITYQEKRVPLTPLSVELLVKNGHQVCMMSQAGAGANFNDMSYSEVGAEIVDDPKKVYECEVILKVDPPTEEEIEWMRPGQLLISALQMAEMKESFLRLLMRKRVNAIAYEFIRDELGVLPIIRAMSEIAGRATILIAAEFLTSTHFGKGELLGGIPGVQPTKIVVIGAGAVGEYVVKAAIGLGAQVMVFDNSLAKLRRLENNVGQRIPSSTLLPNVLKKSLSNCDVAIGALRSPEGRSPCVVSEEMVKSMKEKSLIIDVSIDQGGCFETSEVTNHQKPVFVKHGVLHYCVPNIPSRVARTASYALSNVFAPLMLDMAESNSFKAMLWSHEGLKNGTYLYNGTLTNRTIAEQFNMSCKDIDLLIAGSF